MFTKSLIPKYAYVSVFTYTFYIDYMYSNKYSSPMRFY